MAAGPAIFQKQWHPHHHPTLGGATVSIYSSNCYWCNIYCCYMSILLYCTPAISSSVLQYLNSGFSTIWCKNVLASRVETRFLPLLFSDLFFVFNAWAVLSFCCAQDHSSPRCSIACYLVWLLFLPTPSITPLHSPTPSSSPPCLLRLCSELRALQHHSTFIYFAASMAISFCCPSKYYILFLPESELLLFSSTCYWQNWLFSVCCNLNYQDWIIN